MPGGAVAVRITETAEGRRAGMAGLSTCGSVWACPVCSAKIAAGRQRDIEAACSFWEAQGGALAMATFTVAHRLTNSLTSVWDAVAAGWHSVTSGRAWKRNSATFGVEGWIRTVEVTHGDNGWHVHVHVALFLHHGLGAVERATLTAALLGRWRTGIAKHGFSASDRHGADVRMAHGRDAASVLSQYFTKGVYAPDGTAPAELASELAGGIYKLSRGSSTRTPFRVLEDFLTTGDVDDLDLWHEWERGSKGRRQTAWSKGLRTLVELCSEKTDEELAGEELGTVDDTAVLLPPATLRQVVYMAPALLDAAELGGCGGLIAWLRRQKLEYWDPPGRT